MKTLILLTLTILTLASCKKEDEILAKALLPKPHGSAVAEKDTIPDHAELKIRLAKDSTNVDETMLMFDHTANMNYQAGNDALYFPGFGQVSLSSISADGRNMAIYILPYKPDMSIGLNIKTKSDGDYSLAIDYEKAIPANLHVWIRDNYMKNSVDACSGSYRFKVAKADTNSFGSNRFSLVFKQAM